MKIIMILGAMIILLNGCATIPTQKEISIADYGTPISQKDAEIKALNFLKQNLKDPDSAKIEWKEIKKGWMREAIIYGHKLLFGYILEANVNAKNSYGGYIGYKLFTFVFFNDSIISVYKEGESFIEKIY